MKKIYANSKGNIVYIDVNDPIIDSKGVLVQSSYSLISSGTELDAIEMAKFESVKPLSLLKNIITSKKFRKRFFEEIKLLIKRNSIKKLYSFYKAYSKKFNDATFSFSSNVKLRSLGYSCSGIVTNSNLKDYKINDRVACAGSNHAEKVFSPKNLTCKIPDNVSFEEAAFVAIGAIALHAIHRANIKPGEYIGVIGTGLIGLIVVQLVKLCGAKVFAFDIISKRLILAKKLGANYIFNPKIPHLDKSINDLTNGFGLDSIIICASSNSSDPLISAIELIRNNGKIVILGAVPINLDRKLLYQKEADLLISRSYGPGRYDPYYEYEGFDYPIKYIPWTERRNMELFLRLISENKINVKSLITDIIRLEDAQIAYNKLDKDPINHIAVLLKTSKDKKQVSVSPKNVRLKKRTKDYLNIGLIGCGRFAQEVHLPLLLANNHCVIKGICTRHHKTASYCKQKYNPEYVTTNYKKILNDSEIDTVFIYTRHNTHEKYTIEAIKSGKNIYVEKPMGISLEECKNVYNNVKNSKSQYFIGFNRRYSPFIQLSKKLIANKKNPIIINYRIASSFISGTHWVFDPKIGGGPLVGELCHFMDLVLYLMNSDPIELISRGGNLSHKSIKTYDSSVIIILFQDGSIANIIYTDLNGQNTPKEKIEIFSGDSSITIDDFEKMNTDGFEDGNYSLKNQNKGHKEELNNVINSIIGLQEPILKVDDAIKAMDLCFKTIDSMKNKKAINIEDNFYAKK